jgi:uncharacterized protein YjbI with pentapeptide repeats
MANEEHVAILKQGVEAWNEWAFERFKSLFGTEDRFSVFADFSGADFSGADLSGLDLSGTDFSGANLNNANLYEANFDSASLNGTNLQGVNLKEAELMLATLVNADLRAADLESAGLVETNLSGTNLSGANLSRAYLQKANLRSYKRITSEFEADSKRGKSEVVVFQSLSGATLSGANFNETQYDDDTVWPEGFLPPQEAVKVDYWPASPAEPPLAVSVAVSERHADQPTTNKVAQWWDSILKWLKGP